MSDTESGQLALESGAKSRDQVERELESRLRATVKDQRGTLTLTGQDAHQQAELFGGK